MPHPNRNRYDVITIGDTMLDLFFHIHEANVACQKKPGKCLLCLEYSEKIPVQSVINVPGAGNASNAAIGTRRLGLKSAIVSILGTDPVAQTIKQRWKKERVGISWVTTDKKHETSLSAVLQFQGDRTILVSNQPRTYTLPSLPSCTWIYYTALGPKHTLLEKQLLQYLKRHTGTALLFNPGPHHIRRGWKSLSPILKRSNLLILNKEEAAHILASDAPVTTLVDELLARGAQQVVVTDGPEGAWAGDGSHVWHCPIFPGPIVERTGAGDSFAVGVLFGLSQQRSLGEALRYGTANAWSVVQYVGPHAGLLSSVALFKTLHRFRAISSRLIHSSPVYAGRR